MQKATSPKILGQALKSARTKKRLTQDQAGKLVGITQAMVSRFECGESNIRIDTLFRLLSALELELHVNPRGRQAGQGEGDNW
ncbi:MAG: helix-turn-helix transcriptional regulator [Thermodesulfobacteriota bacterium]|nr:helix-turn-helix transcriptional regulator [Thermodesulfobacteriota bacterium]